MARTIAQMGVPSLEAKGFLGTNPCLDVFPARGFSGLHRPIFGVILNLRYGEGARSLGICTPGRRVTTVLASGGAGARSTAEIVLEKELKFSPAFGDYVKVLESIQTDRSKFRSSESDGSSSRNRLAGKEGSGRNPGDKNLADPGVSYQRRGVDKDSIAENYLDGEQFAHERRDKHSRDERRTKLGRDRTKRKGWDLLEDTMEKSRAWKGGGKDKNSRNVSKHSLDNVVEVAHSRNLNEKQVDYLDNVSKRENDPKQNGKHGKSGQIHDKQTTGKPEGERYPIQDENLKSNYTQRKEHLNSLGRTMSKSEKIEKLFGGTSFSGNRFQAKLGEVKTSKSQFKKISTWKGNSDGTFAKSEFTRSRTERGMYKIQIGKRRDESLIPGNLPSRGNSPGRIDENKEESHVRSSEPSMLGIASGKVEDMSLDDMEIDATDHCDHSPKCIAFDNSREIKEEERKKGHVVRYYGDVIVPVKFVSKADKDAGRNVNDVVLDDRAAFKTFEVFTDIKNRPRVLRMELEERIQNLAKRLNATDVNMPEWHFSKMMYNAKIKFTDHSILRVVQMLGAFGNWRRVLQVVEWLQSRERFKSYKSRYIYTTVLSVLGKAKRPMEALNVFYAMRHELSSYPDLAAYHCIAVTLGQAGLMKELFDVIDRMRAIPEKKFKLGMLQKWDPRLEPDLVIYNAVLNACVQQKQWEGAFWVLQELKQKGIRPSSTTYGLVMEVMLVCGKYNLVHEFFKKVQKSSIPGALNYKVLVNTFWREGRIDEAVLAVRDMERRGIVGSASLYYDLARCLCSAGRCQEALLQVEKLCKVAQKPLVVTYTGLIQTCLDYGSIQNATFIFNQMHKFCSPNVVTCNIMLKSYVEHGMFQEAKSLFQMILEGSECINEESDLRGKVLPDKFTFNTMMEACIDARHWDDFEFTYKQMLCYGYHFDANRHLGMVMEASRAGKVQLLDTTFEHLICSGRTPPPAIVKERFFLRLQDGDYVAALSCLDINKPGKLQAYSERSWLDTLDVKLNCLGKAVLIRLAEEINSLPSQSHQSSPIVENLLNACKKIINSSTIAIDQQDNQRMLSCHI